jgi:hypothetical protein
VCSNSAHLDLVSVLVRCSGNTYRHPWLSGLISWLLPEVVRIPVHPIKSNPQLRQPAGSPSLVRLRWFSSDFLVPPEFQPSCFHDMDIDVGE